MDTQSSGLFANNAPGDRTRIFHGSEKTNRGYSMATLLVFSLKSDMRCSNLFDALPWQGGDGGQKPEYLFAEQPLTLQILHAPSMSQLIIYRKIQHHSCMNTQNELQLTNMEVFSMRYRKFNRIRFESQAMIMTGEQAFEVSTENLSLNGLFVRTDQKMLKGERAEIRINVPSASRSPFLTVDGEVVRNDNHGLAFQFKSLDHDSFSYLKTVINRKSPHRLKTVFNI
jgi:hypothetical protein